MSHLETTLARLAQSFTVRDIMVTSEELIRAGDKSHAQQLFQENSDFDVIPIEQKGILTSYLERGSDALKPIRIQDIVSDATSILDLVDILRGQKFCFVLASQRIAGYVHFSDLNHHIVKIPFFVMLEAVEQRLVDELESDIGDEHLDWVLGPQVADEMRTKMERLKKKRANPGWPHVLNFEQLVLFARYFDKVNLKGPEIQAISKVRNLVCHASDPLVESHEHVKRLADTRRVCLSKLKDMWET